VPAKENDDKGRKMDSQKKYSSPKKKPFFASCSSGCQRKDARSNNNSDSSENNEEVEGEREESENHDRHSLASHSFDFSVKDTLLSDQKQAREYLDTV
jgi:hypothetical protein